MPVPAELAAVLAARDALPGLAAAADRLSGRYRDGVGASAPALRDRLEREAYAAVRMPATAAAVDAALAALGPPPAASHLDLGSGTGAALWAVAGRLAAPCRRTALERDADAIALARELAGDALDPCTWVLGDLRALPPLPAHDLVTISYALNELDAAARAALVGRAWDLAAGWLLLVEPGTPRGASAIAAARRQLIAAGAVPLGPCTHAAACPLDPAPPGAPGWCHQRVRLPRSRLHRAAKGAALGWEDEPFSWLAVARRGAPCGGERVVGPPLIDKGRVRLPLCGAGGFRMADVPRRDADAWRAARALEWGDRC